MKTIAAVAGPLNDPSSGPNSLSYLAALESPCATCDTAPCCTHLPLHTFKITHLTELNHAIYLLNFERIELGLSANGDWHVYYRYPCRHLNRETFGCSVHNQPEQPNICVHYNPYNCWYKRTFTKLVSEHYLVIDEQRMQFILDNVVFDQERNITQVPTWDALTSAFAELPLRPNDQFSEPPLTDDAALDEWQTLISLSEIEVAPAPAKAYAYSVPALQSPCDSCAAYCCETLLFPLGQPQSMDNLDYYRFCLGFPGVELGIAEGQWSLVVKTRCRHLQDGRCALYGQPERPLLCKYYDAWKCSYRTQFGTPRPQGFLRLRLEQFPWLTETFQFDDHGQIIAHQPVEAMRLHVEERLRQHG